MPVLDIQSGAELPPFRQIELRSHDDAARIITRRIQHDRVPLQADDLRRDIDPAFGSRQWRGVLKVDVQMRRPRGHLHLKRIDVERIARPLDAFAIGVDDEPAHPIDRSARRMIARQPLRVEQRQRSGNDRNNLVNGEDMALEIGNVDPQRDGAFVRRVLRWVFDSAGDCSGGPQYCRNDVSDAPLASPHADNTFATACAKYSRFSRRKPAMLIRLSSVM